MNTTRSERRKNNHGHKKKYIVGSSLLGVIIIVIYMSIGPWIPYGHALLSIKEYKGIKQEEKLIKKIVYGYEFALTDKYDDEKDFVDQDDVGIPKKTISATKILTKRMIDQNGLYLGEQLMGQVYRDFLGKDDIDYKAETNDIKKDVPDQLSSLNKSAMIDLSKRGVLISSKRQRNINIAKHFAKQTGTIQE